MLAKGRSNGSLPRGVRATIRTRRSSALSTRLTRPFATEAVDSSTDRARGEIDDRAYRIDGQGPFVQQDFQYAEIREAEPGLFNTSGRVLCQGAHRLHHYQPDVVRPLSHKKRVIKNLNLQEAYSINYIDIKMIDAM